jgi:hypothetical protein
MKTAKMYFPDEEIVKACSAYLLKVSVNGKSPRPRHWPHHVYGLRAP